MIHALLILFAAQLLGETAARLLGLPLPGPVIGMVALVVAMVALPPLVGLMRPLTQGILGHMSLLFVPAGTGVVGHIGVLSAEGLPILAALVGSTILALAAGALTFRAVAHLTGTPEEPET